MSSTQTALAVLIFAGTYLLICFQNIPRLRLDRPGAALVGAVLMVICGILTFDQAWQAIEAHTIVLLLGMMILNVFLDLAGFFDLAAHFILRLAGTPLRLLMGLCLVSGLLSALFLNDTVCLMLTPPLLVILRRTELPPAPFLIALAMSANVGSVMTITGNPQNMLIGQFGHISYLEFLAWQFPVGVVGMAAMILLLRWHYAPAFRKRPLLTLGDGPLADSPHEVKYDKPLLIKSLAVLFLVLLGFVCSTNLALVAISGAGLLIIWSRIPTSAILAKVDWVLLLFFACLFIVVDGLEQTGVVKQIAAVTRDLHGPTLATQVPVFSLITAIACNVVSNVPYVILAQDIVPEFSEPRLMWLVLAMASTFAGNLTIPGSVATLIVLEAAKKEVTISFFEFFVVGLKVVLVTVTLGALLLIGEQFLSKTFSPPREKVAAQRTEEGAVQTSLIPSAHALPFSLLLHCSTAHLLSPAGRLLPAILC
ncbi:MAG: anion transporter [Planctomycetales bacterium]